MERLKHATVLRSIRKRVIRLNEDEKKCENALYLRINQSILIIGERLNATRVKRSGENVGTIFKFASLSAGCQSYLPIIPRSKIREIATFRERDKNAVARAYFTACRSNALTNR